MEKKYISENRYKKGSIRKRRTENTVRNNLSSRKQIESPNIQDKKVIVKKKKVVRKKKRASKLQNIITCVILLILIGVISRAIFKDTNEPFIPFLSWEKENTEEIKIGIITSEALNAETTKNLLLTEFNKYSKEMLLTINQDYSIDYELLESITKFSNNEYVLKLNKNKEIKSVNVKNAIDSSLLNIKSTTIVDEETLKVLLENDDPYFIYNLEIGIESEKSDYTLISSNKNEIMYERYKRADETLPAKVVIKRYDDVYDEIEAFKNGEINVFLTNAENVETLIGNYEYNIKTYRNGETLFLFSNPESKLYAKEEVRKAVLYGIDRASVIKDVLKGKGSTIDLPYIYDVTKYKYDIYAAENLLLTNNYSKVGNVYTKTENGLKTTLTLELIVNKNDEIKVQVAEKIKNNLTSIGIQINVNKLAEDKLKQRINNKDYDLLLANVNLNNSPDITFVMDNLYITEGVNQEIENVNNSNIQELSKTIQQLQNKMSESISAIGIYADTSYVVYSKSIIGIDCLSYMKILKKLL